MAALAASLFAVPCLAEEAIEVYASIDSPAPVGSLVTFTASVANSQSSYSYRFSAGSFEEGARIIKDFGPNPSFDWSPVRREGLYQIRIDVRDNHSGEISTSLVPFEVRSNVTDTPVVSSTGHPLVYLYSAPACAEGSQMTVWYWEPGGEVQKTPALDCDGFHSMNTYVAGLRPESQYSIRHVVTSGGVDVQGPTLDFETGRIDWDLPTFQRSGRAGGTKPVMLAASIFAYPTATDLNGNPIWFYPEIVTSLTHVERGGYFFAVDQGPSGDPAYQVLRLFDLAGVTVLETNAARINEQLAAQGKRRITSFHHEARYLSNGNIVTLASIEELLTDVQGPGTVDVLGDMIIVLDPNLNVVWTWDTFDHLDPHRKATLNNTCTPGVCPPLVLATEANDWTHGNAVSETPDGNLLYSTRHQDWVIKVDYAHGSGSGNIIWKLGRDGDFAMQSSDPEPWFSHQHAPELSADGSLIVFDNGNFRAVSDPQTHSRGQVLQLDESSHTATLKLNADLGLFSFALGSAQVLGDGGYFFDAGYQLDGTSVLIETDAGGTVTRSFHGSAPVYRAFRMNSLYGE